jgi:hypothetical protein
MEKGSRHRALVARLLMGLGLGLALGLVYAWVLRPIEYVDTTPGTLREDFRVDYILMVAQAYGAEGDQTLAQVRLAALGPQDPLDYVVHALEYALAYDFSQRDLDSLSRLAAALRGVSGGGGGGP